MPYLDEEDALDEGVETRRKHKGAGPKVKRTRRDLLWAAGQPRPTSTTEFADADMQMLYDRGYFDRFVGELKGGKEATVFLVAKGEERLAAKVYADIDVRTFRNDAVYWSGFYVSDARARKAMQSRSRTGKRVQQGIWVTREYHYLWRLHREGLPVPRPAVGPEPSAIDEAGSVVLMEFVGDGDVPAPRLSDVRLAKPEAESAFAQTEALFTRLAQLGLVHGDLSTYNLLWHHGKVWLIDVPQMVEIEASRPALELLARDARSIVTSFRRLGVHGDGDGLVRAAHAVMRER
ncbi:MAG TPA: RIO1 family regulatory kinase/ATPase [Trueperaceae bacterium]|nr:RIO1 family regulatory kinase/ATPase [Trueperaceae bacterium]